MQLSRFDWPEAAAVKPERGGRKVEMHIVYLSGATACAIIRDVCDV